MIKAVSFDYGGVLNRGGTINAFRDRVCAALRIDQLQFDRLGLLREQIYRGHITPAQFWNNCAQLLNIALPEDHQERWNELDQVEPVQQLYQVARELRGRGIPTAILSNITAMSTPTIRSANGYDGFDPVILSCEVGFAKPDPEIYSILSHRLSLAPDEIIHLDDQDSYLDGAKSVGLQTLKVTSPDQANTDLRKVLSDQAGVSLS